MQPRPLTCEKISLADHQREETSQLIRGECTFFCFRCRFHIQINLWCEDFSIVSRVKKRFFCSANAGCRRPPISSKKGKLQSKNNEKCHNSCHDLFLSSSSVNNHRYEILHTFLEHQIKRSIKRIFYYIFHPFFKLKLHPLCAKGWAENF